MDIPTGSKTLVDLLNNVQLVEHYRDCLVQLYSFSSIGYKIDKVRLIKHIMYFDFINKFYQLDEIENNKTSMLFNTKEENDEHANTYLKLCDDCVKTMVKNKTFTKVLDCILILSDNRDESEL
ncbi:hypothetical protein [Carboxylicivirga sp. M1479]|uniref:hypothetical protein n=1 Tax=Carboxylicivirga sp. M1479 TaxID=2594476 RepID=UPI001177B72C|nr:hypothetical protein [Carboxylicivirga sp. M1479]TRX71524.1 hypothetical protein FNN09_06015 [Carboxylicivirga sp. M1479]